MRLPATAAITFSRDASTGQTGWPSRRGMVGLPAEVRYLGRLRRAV